MQTKALLASGAAALCLVAALVLVTGDARQAPSVLMARTTMMAGGLEVTTIKEGSGETAAVPHKRVCGAQSLAVCGVGASVSRRFCAMCPCPGGARPGV